MITVKAKFDTGLKSYINGVYRRATDKKRLLTRAGKLYVGTISPQIFLQRGLGWKYPLMRTGMPLLDTGPRSSKSLAKSIEFEVPGPTLLIGSRDKRAGVHNGQHGDPFIVRPRRRRWLTVPDPRFFTSAKQMREAKASDWMGTGGGPKAFFMEKGPQGTGIYMRKPDARTTKGYRLVHLFWCVKEVHIPARPFLFWTPGILRQCTAAMVDYIARGPRAGTP